MLQVFRLPPWIFGGGEEEEEGWLAPISKASLGIFRDPPRTKWPEIWGVGGGVGKEYSSPGRRPKSSLAWDGSAAPKREVAVGVLPSREWEGPSEVIQPNPPPHCIHGLNRARGQPPRVRSKPPALLRYGWGSWENLHSRLPIHRIKRLASLAGLISLPPPR